jgi:hypothetical protein
MKKILGVALFFALAAIFIVYTLYNKPHRNPANEATIQINSNELFDKFHTDESNANALYLNKVLEVKGKILEITTNHDQATVIVLETNDPVFGIRCSMNSSTNARVADLVIVQGICTGFLSDVIITNAFLKENIKEDE